ncbi:MAG: long-chain fatty acid--CoA ligase [Betaproteobacteria bacterium]|nr:MAG: long-chain fatty acid--CoA ligase [Betaproteobacteria bacterium]
MAATCPEPRGYPGNLGVPFVAHAGLARTALIDLRDPQSPREHSFRDLDLAANAVARGLLRSGLQQGDRIGILALNRAEFVVTLLGAMRAGVIPVPINVKLATDTVRYIVRDAGARLAFCESAYAHLLPPDLPAVRYDDGDAFAQFLDPGPYAPIEPAPDTVAIQPYTSGSTGKPKGVLLTHYGQNWSRLILVHTRNTTDRDVILVAAPLYHKNALNAIKQGLTAGATLVLLPQFNVEHYIAAIARYRCTVISGVPTMVSMVLARKDLLTRTDTTTVRTVMMGSAPSSPQLLSDIRAHFPNAEPLVVYGVTEGGPVPLGPDADGRPRPPGSIGKPYPGTAAKLINGPHDNEGELLLKNPGILLGYHNLPDETARRIRDGWYHTGDVCRRDADGFYYFIGRTDDMFVCGGENIFPIEVERLLERHPAVHQACVLPFAHDLKGQVPYAFIVLRSSASATADEIKNYALANGPAYQHPRRVFFLEQLPLAGTNKVDREQLRSLAAREAANTDRAIATR